MICLLLALAGCGKSEEKQLQDSLKDEISLSYLGDVHNDKTGKWKLAECVTTEEMSTYLPEYYAAYFGSDDEVHALVNFSNNTTSCIKVSDSNLMIEVHEYVKGEELDAGKLFSGMLIKTYVMDKETGEITDEW